MILLVIILPVMSSLLLVGIPLMGILLMKISSFSPSYLGPPLLYFLVGVVLEVVVVVVVVVF